MTSLSAVKVALERGNKDDALYLLRKVLKERPNAEAHYLAAKLAPNRLMAKKHLVEALHYDSKHEAVLTMLQVIVREERLSKTDKLRTDLMEAVEMDENEDEDTRQGYLAKVKNWMATTR